MNLTHNKRISVPILRTVSTRPIWGRDSRKRDPMNQILNEEEKVGLGLLSGDAFAAQLVKHIFVSL